MSATQKRKNTVRVFSMWESELEPTTPRRARVLLDAGVAKPYSPYDGPSEFAIKLTTETRSEAFRKVKNKLSEGKFTQCWECGIPLPESNPSCRQWCPDCFNEYETNRKNELANYLQLRAKIMLERALRMLEKQEFPVVVIEYKEASEVIRERIKKETDAFDSAHEMLAVMELLRNRIHVKLQANVGKYRVDILLPEEKVILEIDGYMHKFSKSRDKKRDINIRIELGNEWEIVRIPTIYIEQNIRQLVPAIRKMKKEMQKARKQNNGLLPEHFSERDKVTWARLRKKVFEAK